MLFVPAHNSTLIEKAASKQADACILDLEDSVPPEHKSAARAGLRAACSVVVAGGCAPLVRVNSYTEGVDGDELRAAVVAGARAIILPKVDKPEMVCAAATIVESAERERGDGPSTWLIAQIEDVAALPNLDDIAQASPRLLGMSLGTEDFSASAGMEPTPETLYWPSQQLVFACRRNAILPFGFPASIAEFGDIALLELQLAKAAQMGFMGAMCIHPNQVAVLNQAFTPTKAEVEHSRALLSEWEAAQQNGLGVFKFEGKMVDLPVVLRAQALMRRHAAIKAKA